VVLTLNVFKLLASSGENLIMPDDEEGGQFPFWRCRQGRSGNKSKGNLKIKKSDYVGQNFSHRIFFIYTY